MAGSLYDRASPSMSTGVKLSLGRQTFRFNVFAFVVLFVGYFLTTGTGVIESEGAKAAFRFIALLVFLANVILGRAFRVQYAVALFFLYIVLALNQSQIAVNMVFLLLILASLHRLSGKEVAVAFLAPTIIVVVLHVLLLNTGQLVVQATEFAGRSRSTLGFANANQTSVIYLSFVILSVFTHIQFSNRTSMFLVAVSYGAAVYVILSTDTRTALIALILLISFQVLGSLFYRFKAYRASLTLLGSASPFFASAATYYLTTSADPALNFLLSLRPYFFAQFMSNVTPADFVFGWRTDGDSGVDNLFLMLLSGVGAIGYLLILLSVSYRIYRMNPKFIPIVVVLMAISIFESSLLRPEIQLSALFLYLVFHVRHSDRSGSE